MARRNSACQGFVPTPFARLAAISINCSGFICIDSSHDAKEHKEILYRQGDTKKAEFIIFHSLT